MNAALVYVLAILAAPVLWALGLGASELVQQLRARRAQRRPTAPRTTVAEIIQRIDAERFVQEFRDGEVRWAAARDQQGRAGYWPTCDPGRRLRHRRTAENPATACNREPERTGTRAVPTTQRG
ncbi:hypothetical protein [Haloechinothrix salitolerans]|uniref:Uncharacterized protein n=1 Tax=Haloechinothrix salitolerans TaxID=926830 RepID=A0ABW2BXZ5_9PSEU